MRRMNLLDWVAFALVIIGAINWGLVGVFDFDLVAIILGEMTTLSRIVYSLVGISGVYLIISAAIKPNE